MVIQFCAFTFWLYGWTTKQRSMHRSSKENIEIRLINVDTFEVKYKNM